MSKFNNFNDRETYMNKSKNSGVPRNSEIFEKLVLSKGKSLLWVKQMLNDKKHYEFDKYISDDGKWVEQDIKEYSNERMWQASDYGKRTPAQTDLDCTVGNIEEVLFIIKTENLFEINKASTKSSENITTNEDLNYIGNGSKIPVEMKFKSGNVYFLKKEYADTFNIPKNRNTHVLYYNHRNGGFLNKLNDNTKYMIYFYDINKVVFITKKDLGKSVFIVDEGYINSYGKKEDKIIIVNNDPDIVCDFDLFDKHIYKKEIDDLVKVNLEKNGRE